MINLRVVIATIALCVCGVSCSSDSEPAPNTPVTRGEAQQVTLAYFIGTDLGAKRYNDGYYGVNIKDAKEAVGDGVLGEHGRFYYLFPSSATVATLFELRENKDGSTTTREVMNYTLASGDPDLFDRVLEDVNNDVEWAAGGELNMIISGHGSSWLIADKSTQSYQEQHMKLISSFGRRGGAVPFQTRYIGDGGEQGYLNISDFIDVLTKRGITLGFMLFDSCFMSSVEIAYRLRGSVDYIIGSPCEVMGDGFPFIKIIPLMFEDNGTKYDVGGICEAFYNYYNDGMSSSNKKSACVALCVTREMDQLASVVKRIKRSTVYLSDIQLYVPSSMRSSYPFYDLNGYMMKSFASSDYVLFAEQLERAYPSKYRLHTKSYYSQYNDSLNAIDAEQYSGVTTSAPATTVKHYSDWLNEPWAVATTYQN